MTNEEIIAELKSNFQKGHWTIQKEVMIGRALDKARADGKKEGKIINSEIRNIWRKDGFEAGRQSALAEIKKLKAELAEANDKRRNVLWHLHEANLKLSQNIAEHHERVRKLKEGINMFYGNGFDWRRLNKYIDEIFPDCVEKEVVK